MWRTLVEPINGCVLMAAGVGATFGAFGIPVAPFGTFFHQGLYLFGIAAVFLGYAWATRPE